MTATVTQLHTTPNLSALDQDALLAIVQRDAAMRAVYRVIDILKAALKRVTNEWKDKRTEATKAYREHLRDEDREALRGAFERIASGARLTERDRQNLATIGEHYFAACDGLAKHDDVLSDGKADKDARAKQIAKFEAAHRELSMQGRDGGSAQVAMFEPETTGKGAALAMTDETKEHVYAALLQLDKDGGLDDAQKHLLAELGAAGIKALDLGINAAAAVEQAVADEPDDDEADDDGETEIPF